MNLLLKYFYKYTDKEKYYLNKQQVKTQKKIHQYQSEFESILLQIQQAIQHKKTLNFLHSGHLGDIIYSLPILKHLAQTHSCNLYIQVNKPFGKYYHKHPANGVLLNEKLAQMLLPLLAEQNYLQKAEIYNNQSIDINLDHFRKIPMSLFWHTNRWYFQLTGIEADIQTPYLSVPPLVNKNLQNKIVIVRTFRARSPFVNYDILQSYKDLLFIGLPNEYEDLKPQIPQLEYYNPSDFKEMAQIISSARYFIGNQSFAYSLAEAMKVPRLLEGNPDFPVVHPVGPNGKDFFFQPYFKELVKEYHQSYP